MARPQHAAARGRGRVGGIGRRAARQSLLHRPQRLPRRTDPLYREFLEWRASRAKASTNR